ncbi:hypothetical protein D9M68_819730 [compost metagenome]
MVVTQEHGVAIGRRDLERMRGELAARTGFVVHQHVVPELGLQALGEDARNGIGTATGGEADEDFGGGLRLGQTEAGHGRQSQREAAGTGDEGTAGRCHGFNS